MKKILSLFICFQIITLPAIASYDFSDEAQAEFDRKKFQPVQSAPVDNDFTKKRNHNEDRTNYTPPIILEEVINNTYEPQPKPLLGNVVYIPAGTTFHVTFDSGINSGSLEKDDRLTATLSENLVYNGILIAPAGSLVYGTATDAQNAGYAYGSGAVEFNFNEILTPNGNIIQISTEKIILKNKVNVQKNDKGCCYRSFRFNANWSSLYCTWGQRQLGKKYVNIWRHWSFRWRITRDNAKR